MTVVFRTAGPWGSGKGSDLQPGDVDGNFWELIQDIASLASNPAQPTTVNTTAEAHGFTLSGVWGASGNPPPAPPRDRREFDAL